MQLNYNHLHYFHMAAIEGSVAAAAIRLGVTQPTVSEQIRALERTLGTELFERTQSGLRLTEAGRMTFEITSRMFSFGERLIELFGHRESEAPRTLRIGISNGIARTSTSDFLVPLVALDNAIPSIRSGDMVEILRELRAGLLDLVLCECEPPTAARRGLENKLVHRMPLVAVAAPGVTPAADWKNVRLLQYRASSPLRHEVETFLDAHGLEPPIAAEADDALVLLDLAARTGHVAIVPSAIARTEIAAGRLRVVANVEPSNTAVHALYQDNLASSLARRAVAMLIEHLDGNPEPAA